MTVTGYAELHCLSHFSFLRGASSPAELVEQAHGLGYLALALTDECSLAGIVQAHVKARELGLALIIGSEIRLADGPALVLLAPCKTAYSQLCRLISQGRRNAGKGQYRLYRRDVEALDKTLAILAPSTPPEPQAATWLARHFANRAWIGVELHHGTNDTARLRELQELGLASGLPLVACGDVHMHVRARRKLQDTLTAIRHNCTLHEAGWRLFPNGERHLRPLRRLARQYPADCLRESLKIAERCHFSLDELDYRYPAEEIPAGIDADTYLRQLTEQGLRRRWPQGVPDKVSALIDKELGLIRQLGYAHYFLTVYEIMSWARRRGILCQGRGSAANSAVCFALSITVVNPETSAPLFERFISAERAEPPDIDVDFEHQRREEVFQHIYRKYGRHRAALAATVIRYRPRSAIRDLGKALGLGLDEVTWISQSMAWWDGTDSLPTRLRELGLDPDAPRLRTLLSLLPELIGMPRHLSQHVGGFVICHARLDELVPVENAAMAERTVIQWDKDDLDAIGLFKIDCLALGMLSAIRRSFELIRKHSGQILDIPTVLATEATQGDEARQVFSMLRQAQSIGVFQVESRAQMAMLPRLKPRSLYDLTIQTAIVRPGPIQGGMVHPYLDRRMGRSPVACPRGLETVLGRTLGIPIFQEQVMEICVQAAGFAPGEADQVRRSMAAWGRSGFGKLEQFEARLKQGMAERGYDRDFAESIFQQIKGFAEYGFPESHAASFAVLVYVSAWLKRFHPAAFLAALLNSQPMGFYAPAQLIQHFRFVHTVTVLPPDVLSSFWDSSLEPQPSGKFAVRLGLHMVKGLSESCARRIERLPIRSSCTQLFDAADVGQHDRQALAASGALNSLSGHRHEAHWLAQAPRLESSQLPAPADPGAGLAAPCEPEDIVEDYASLGLSLRRHPLSLLRARLQRMGVITASHWRFRKTGSRCRLAGIVTHRQRPGTAKGIVFITLEDETGLINLVLRQEVLKAYRQSALQARLLLATGVSQSRDGSHHLLVDTLEDHSHLLGTLVTASRDFH